MDRTFVCGRCDNSADPSETAAWRCACGGPWELPAGPPFDPGAIDNAAPGLWRYRAQIRLPPDWPAVSLGEGQAPWLHLRRGPWVSCAYLEPTFSFKARGASVLATWAQRVASPPLIEDSSGNAGAALAAYAAAAGIACRIYVPASAPRGKLEQLKAVGAEVIAVEGPRPRATEAAQKDPEGTYCSHAWNPLFLEGIKTLTFVWWEQQGGRFPPRICVPAGQGSLVLGLCHGFGELAAGQPDFRSPAIVAVQHRDIAPLYEAWEPKPSARVPSTDAGDVGSAKPLADGIAIPDPVRKEAVLEAIRESGGEVRVVDDDAVRAAQRRLAENGLWVEPTSAVALAGYDQAADGSDSLVVLTGHGLKGTG